MLRRIKAEQLQVGMFVARLGGPWRARAFWRSKFLVTTEAQLSEFRSSGVEEVWIDILKGRNAPTPQAATSPWETPAPAPWRPRRP